MTFQVWTIKCVICKKEFEQTHPNQRICESIDCKHAAQKARYAKANKKRRPRLTYQRNCKWCKIEYAGYRKNGLYCSQKCRNDAYGVIMSIANHQYKIKRQLKSIERSQKIIAKKEKLLNG